MGKKVTTVNINNIPPGTDLWWIVACVAVEGKDGLLKIKRSERDTWLGASLEILFQASREQLEKIPDHIALPDHIVLRDLNVMVEGRRPDVTFAEPSTTLELSAPRSRDHYCRDHHHHHYCRDHHHYRRDHHHHPCRDQPQKHQGRR